MKYNNLLLSFFLAVLTTVSLPAQEFSPKITPVNFDIEGGETIGYTTTFPYSQDMVHKSLFSFMKSIGRTQNKDSTFITKEIKGLDPDHSALEIVSQLAGKGDSTLVNMGLDTVGLGTQNFAELSNDIKDLLADFGERLRVENLQAQIEEAEKAATIKSRSHQRLVNEHKSLERKLELNASEKVRLDTALVENAREKLLLQEKKALNKKRQVLDLEDLDKVNRRLEQLKIKLGGDH